MNVFCHRLKLGFKVALNCQGRYHKKELSFLLISLKSTTTAQLSATAHQFLLY
jgi:hypothetical protein